MKHIELPKEDNTETIPKSPLESLPPYIIKDSLLQPFFEKQDWDILRQVRATSKTLQARVEEKDEQDYRARFKKPIKQIAVGSGCQFVLLDNGKVYAWGKNTNGQLGLGDAIDRDEPELVDLPGRAKQVFAGSTSNTMVLLENGDVYVWGSNGFGTLGVGDFRSRRTPVLINLPAPATEIFAGSLFGSFAQLENGEVYAWGGNTSSQLGLGDYETRPTPVPLTLPAPVKKMVQGAGHTLALLENGKFYGWGGAKMVPLGIEGVDNTLQPQEMKFSSPVKDIVNYGLHHLVLLENGDIHVWSKIGGKLKNATDAAAVIAAWNSQPISSLPGPIKQYCERQRYDSNRTYRVSVALLQKGELYSWEQDDTTGQIVQGPTKLDFEFCTQPLLEKTQAKARATPN